MTNLYLGLMATFKNKRKSHIFKIQELYCHHTFTWTPNFSKSNCCKVYSKGIEYNSRIYTNTINRKFLYLNIKSGNKYIKRKQQCITRTVINMKLQIIQTFRVLTIKSNYRTFVCRQAYKMSAWGGLLCFKSLLRLD